MFRNILALGIMIASVCSAGAQAVSPGGARCVGVMSIAGEPFYLKTIGVTVFGNKLQSAPIGSWGIDELVMRKIGAVLGKRRSVSRLPYSKAAVVALNTPNDNLFRDSISEIRDIVKQAAAKMKCDRYIAVTRASTQYGSSNQYLNGIGMLEPGFIGNTTYLYAVMGLYVYDGTTFERLQYKLIGHTFNLLASVRGMVREVDKAWWPSSGTVAGDNRLREAVRGMVDQGVGATIQELIAAGTL